MPLRRKLRLLGTVACVLATLAILVAGGLSLRWYAKYQWRAGPYVSISHGALIVCRPVLPTRAALGGRTLRTTTGFRRGDIPETSRYDAAWWFDITWRGRGDWYIELPMWAVALLPLAAGALIRWLLRDAAAPRSHCARCGYDLAGNTTGICPECGTVR